MSQVGDLDRALKRIERHLADARPGTHDHERWSRQHRLALEALEELEHPLEDAPDGCRCDPATGIYAHGPDGCAGRDPLEDDEPDPGAGQPPWSRVDIEHTPTGGTILETIPTAAATRDRERLAMKLRTHGPSTTTTDAAGRDPHEHPDA